MIYLRAALTVFMLVGLALPALGQSEERTTRSGELVRQVHPLDDQLLKKVEKSDLKFTRLENKNLGIVSFFHQRQIGEAFVEKDFIRYRFNEKTGELVKKEKHWREGLPEVLPAVIPQAEAESIVGGEIKYSKLIYISPNSEIYPISPTPRNPVWVVSTKIDGRPVIEIVDAVTGEKLGKGVPPPSSGFSMYGPNWGDCPQVPYEYWYNHANSARNWFNAMGYTTSVIGNASEAQVQGAIQSDTTAMFFELDHGGPTSFHNQCNSDITAAEVETWIRDWSSMPFTFIGSCDGMCDATLDNRFGFEFRKGNSTVDTVVTGYCGMSGASCESNCWGDAIAWQNEMFTHMSHGDTMWTGFLEANADFPNCATNSCMRFQGDTTLRAVPTGEPLLQRSFSGSVSGHFDPANRDHHIRAELIANALGLQVNSGTTMVFVNNSKLRANGLLTAYGTAGEIRFVSEADRNRGIRIFTSGQLKMLNDGVMKVY